MARQLSQNKIEKITAIIYENKEVSIPEIAKEMASDYQAVSRILTAMEYSCETPKFCENKGLISIFRK